MSLELRVIYLICTNKSFLKQIDLCTSPECMEKPIKVDNFDHHPVHPVVRAPRLVHAQHVGPLNATSWKAYNYAASLMRNPNRIKSETFTGDDDDDDTETTTNISDEECSIATCVCCTKPVSAPFWICVTCYVHHGSYPVMEKSHCF
jgi:hypothetical protein